MGDTPHQRLAEIFRQVVDLDHDEREALLESICKDPAQRREIDALLRGDERDGFLPRSDKGAPELVADALRDAGVGAPSLETLPAQIGRYAIQRELGSGAMGRVLLARQMRTDQLVALKLIRPELSLTTPKALDRFEQETKILGRLSHPGIARILDAGSVRIGGHDQPYLAIEYVPGKHLMDFARDEELGLRTRIDLLAQLCDAVQHAHDQGVVHRDLKPDNIIVTSEGQPKVLDFGVARITDAESQLTTIRTSGGQLIGTLAYMSPEQAAGGALALDGRSDVYALGILGFELLSGRRPHDLTGLDFVAAARVICENDPAPLKVIAPDIPRDMATVLYKALCKEPEGRYATAAALADDLRRFIRDEPIAARPATGLYVMKKLARRHRGLTAGLMLALLALVAGTVVSTVLALRAMHATEAARWQTYLATLAAASSEAHAGSHDRASARLEHSPVEHRGIEWRILRNLTEQSALRLHGHSYNVWGVAVAPDGRRAFSCAGDGTVRVWDLQTGSTIAVLEEHGDRVFSVAVSPDGMWLASGSADRTIRLRDARSLETVAILEGHNEGVFGLAFSHNSEILAAGANNGHLRLWSTADGGLIRVLEEHGSRIWSIAFTPDDARMAVAADDGVVRVYDTYLGQELASLNTENPRAVDVSFHPDGTRLAVGTTSGELQLWDIDTLERLNSVRAHVNELGSVEFSPDGRIVVTGARDGTLSVWDSESLSKITDRIGHSDWAQSLAFSADGTHLVSGSWDDSVRVWDAAHLYERTAPTSQEHVRLFQPSAQMPGLVFVATGEGPVELRDLLTGRLAPAPDELHPLEVLVHTPAGRGDLMLVHSGMPIELRCQINATRGKTHPDGSLIAASIPGTAGVALFDTVTGDHRSTIEAGGVSPYALAFSPTDGYLLVGGYDDCSVGAWSISSRQSVAVLTGHVDAVSGACFDASGDVLATFGADGVTLLWNAHTFEQIGALSNQGEGLTGAAFTPDGTRIATATENGRVRLWSLATLEQLVVLPVATTGIRQLEFALDGSLLLVHTDASVLVTLDAR